MKTKTAEQKLAWLDGYIAATETVESFTMKVASEVDEIANTGTQLVGEILRGQIKKFQVELANEEKSDSTSTKLDAIEKKIDDINFILQSRMSLPAYMPVDLNYWSNSYTYDGPSYTTATPTIKQRNNK